MKNRTLLTLAFIPIILLSFAQNDWTDVYLMGKCKPHFVNTKYKGDFEENLVEILKSNSKIIQLLPSDVKILRFNGIMCVISAKGQLENIIFVNDLDNGKLSDELKEEIVKSLKSLPQIKPAVCNRETINYMALFDLSNLVEKEESHTYEYYYVPEPTPPPPKPPRIEEPEVFTIVEEMPRFGGCEESLKNEIQTCNNKNVKEYVDNELKNLTSTKTGVVYVKFIVDETGKVINAEVKKGVNEQLDEAALEIVKNMPDWIPGKQRGKPVNVSIIIPVYFN